MIENITEGVYTIPLNKEWMIYDLPDQDVYYLTLDGSTVAILGNGAVTLNGGVTVTIPVGGSLRREEVDVEST